MSSQTDLRSYFGLKPKKENVIPMVSMALTISNANVLLLDDTVMTTEAKSVNAAQTSPSSCAAVTSEAKKMKMDSPILTMPFHTPQPKVKCGIDNINVEEEGMPPSPSIVATWLVHLFLGLQLWYQSVVY